METYKKTITIENPRLVIEYCDYVETPREWSNLGYFITCDRNYNSPDRIKEIERIVQETSELATSQAEHMQAIKDRFSNGGYNGEKVIAIFPVVKYEHSGVSYSLGTAHGFDYSNNGFYIITDKTQKETGTKKKDFEKRIKSELEVYNKWANGEVLEFVLYDKNGEVEDSCSGFYDIEDIREHLPDEWKDEDLNKYLK